MTSMPLEPGGIYLHWPFCERKCPYCDFYTFGREHPAHAGAGRYAEVLIEEIRTTQERFGLEEPPRVDTVYFGGGTPSLMGAAALERVLAALEQTFRIAGGAEITLEVNPTTAETAGLEDLLACGVNRISLGCQSFQDHHLQRLGRLHDAATARRAVAMIRALRVANLSLDIMFGLPGQTMAELEADIGELLALAPEHISAYNLTYHEGTPFERWRGEGRIEAAEDELERAMFERLIERLGAAGFVHYEISNWSREGLASRHNSKYWRKGDVFAFGASAHGVLAGERYANPRDLRAYMQEGPAAWAPALDPPEDETARRGEVMMLALRRLEGVGWDELRDWLGADARVVYAEALARLAGEGLIEMDERGARLSREGLFMENEVAGRFF